MSFGFKYGLPIDADLVFDVRSLQTPTNWNFGWRSGSAVYDYVMDHPESEEFYGHLHDMIVSLPSYKREVNPFSPLLWDVPVGSTVQ